MLKTEAIIINKLGLHARAAAKLVTLAMNFKSSVEIEFNGRKINAKSIMGVMMLAAAKGSKLSIEINGEDETFALEEILTLIKNRFGEKI